MSLIAGSAKNILTDMLSALWDFVVRIVGMPVGKGLFVTDALGEIEGDGTALLEGNN